MVLDLSEDERAATDLAIAHAAALAAGARMRLLHAVASACNEATSLDCAAPAILRLVCEHFAWDSGCLARFGNPVSGDVPALEVVHGVGDATELAAHTSTHQLTGAADGNVTLSGRDVLVPVALGRVDGRVWVFRTAGGPVDEDQLEVLTLIGIATSQVVERTIDARRLRDSEERFRAVFDSSPLPMGLTLGDEGTYSEVNAALCDLLGYAPDVLRGMSAADLLHPDDIVLADPAGAAAAAAPDGRHRLEMRLMHSSGKVITSRVTLAWMDGADGNRQLLAQMEDITARRAAEDMLRWQADHDSLTGLANRAELSRVLAEQGEAGAVCALLFIDLDGFKLINDTRGHEVGDDVLVGIAARLLDAVRPSDVVARFGGDEFVIVCRDVSLEPGSDRAQRVADRIEAALIAPFDTAGGPARVTASIGIAAGRVDAREPQELLLRADKAMYRAKTLGRDRRAVYDDELHQRATERSRTEAALRTALADGRFVLHFQPVVELDGATVVGFEALVRLINERGDIVAPADFITVAEQSGLIIAMGTWVLRESCRTIADLRARSGRRLTVSVNVSARQAAKLEFADVVCDALASSGLPNDALMLELTESSLLEADESTLRQLVMLRDRGVGIALDDFGTGYSSLSYLRRLPVSCLKIDRSFVSDIVETDSDRAIVRAVIGLAEDLGLGWIAEGIETAEQLEVLAGIGGGVGQGQGYLFSRPVPADRLVDVLGIPAAEPSSERITR